MEPPRKLKLPNEDERTELAVKVLHKHAGIAEQMISAAIEVHDKFRKLEFRSHEPRVQGIISGVFAQAIMRFHVAYILCGYALPDDVPILVRSLFEHRLALNFILRPEPAPGWKKPKKFPRMVPGRDPMAFRADLYAAAKPIHRVGLDEDMAGDPVLDIPRVAAGVVLAKRQVKKIETLIGPEWRAFLGKGKRGYSGMKVHELAAYCGQTAYYVQMYSQQSLIAHGGDAMSFLRKDRIYEIEYSLELGTSLLGECVQEMDTTFELGQSKLIDHLVQRLDRIINKSRKRKGIR